MKTRILNLSVLVLLAVAFVEVFARCELPFGAWGTNDFLEYWSAWRLLQDGLNPYDASLLHHVQLSVGQAVDTTIMMWNPPWTVVLLAPVLMWPFSSAAVLWALVELNLLCFLAIMVPPALGRARPSLWISVAAVIAFVPILDSLIVGQLGVLLTCSVVGFLLLERKECFFLAGLSLVPLTCKPHLVFLFLVPGLLWLRQLTSRELKLFLCGLCGGLGIFVVLTLVVDARSLTWWLDSLSHDVSEWEHIGVHPVWQWNTATLATLVRNIVSSPSDPYPLWPMWAVPAASFIGTVVFFARYKNPICWGQITPALMCVSLVTTSYGWLFDQSVLVMCQVAIVCDALTYRNRLARALMMSLVVLVEIVGFKLRFTPGIFSHHFVWFPIAMLTLLYLNRRFLACERSVVS